MPEALPHEKQPQYLQSRWPIKKVFAGGAVSSPALTGEQFVNSRTR